MKQRLLTFLEYLGIGQNAFEKKVGWAIGTIGNMQHGVRSDKLADVIKTYPDLNIRWLLTGEGDMLLTHDPEVLSNVNGMSPEQVEVLVTTIKAQSDTIASMQELISKMYGK